VSQCTAKTTEGNQCKLQALAGTTRCKRHTAKKAAQTLPFESAREAAATVGFLHSGNYVLDYVVSGRLYNGGWPLGHVTEIYGAQSTGKSFLINRAIAQAQRQGGDALLDDTEGAFNPDWAEEALGVDPDSLRLTQSLTVKDHYEVAKVYLEWLGTQPISCSVLALDSIAVLSTEQEISNAFEKRDMTRAQEVRMLFRTLKRHVRKVPCAFLCTNHVIANIGGWNDTTTPTGSGLKFHAGVRVELRSPRKIKLESTGEYTGVIVNVFVEKNRFGPPWRQCRIAIPFHEPINPLSGLIPFLLDYGYFGVNGASWLIDSSGESIGIRAHKSDFLKQDQAAAELLGLYPNLIEEVDTWLRSKASAVRTAGEVVEDEGV